MNYLDIVPKEHGLIVKSEEDGEMYYINTMQQLSEHIRTFRNLHIAFKANKMQNYPEGYFNRRQKIIFYYPEQIIYNKRSNCIENSILGYDLARRIGIENYVFLMIVINPNYDITNENYIVAGHAVLVVKEPKTNYMIWDYSFSKSLYGSNLIGGYKTLFSAMYNYIDYYHGSIDYNHDLNNTSKCVYSCLFPEDLQIVDERLSTYPKITHDKFTSGFKAEKDLYSQMYGNEPKWKNMLLKFGIKESTRPKYMDHLYKFKPKLKWIDLTEKDIAYIRNRAKKDGKLIDV